MKQITVDCLRNRIEEEMSYDKVEQIQVTYCCPAFTGGYKKEVKQTFPANADEVVNAVANRNSKIALGKIDAAYTEGDFLRTLSIDIIEL